MSCPSKLASMRGDAKVPSMTPSSCPRPPTAISLVGAPNAVMNAAINRSLSCQSALVTRNGMRERPPYAVRPWNSISVYGVARRLGSISIPAGSTE